MYLVPELRRIRCVSGATSRCFAGREREDTDVAGSSHGNGPQKYSRQIGLTEQVSEIGPGVGGSSIC